MRKNSNNEPLVSVIVPVYNQERYLSECLDSLLVQTYNNIEILLVNDGSDDKSKEICQKYVSIDDRFVLHNKNNGGLSDARNYGIEKSHGEYVCFVDGDDLVDNRFISELIHPLLNESGCLISCCRYKRFSDKNEIKNDEHGKSECEFIDPRSFLIKTLRQSDQTLYTVSACTKMYKREVFKSFRFAVGKLYEDFIALDSILELAKNIAVIDKQLYDYRVNSDSITNGEFDKDRLVLLKNCDRLKEKFKKDKQVMNAVSVMEYTRAYELLMSISRAQNENNVSDVEKELWMRIKKTRVVVLFSTGVRFMIRLSAVISFMGRRASVGLFKLKEGRANA